MRAPYRPTRLQKFFDTWSLELSLALCLVLGVGGVWALKAWFWDPTAPPGWNQPRDVLPGPADDDEELPRPRVVRPAQVAVN